MAQRSPVKRGRGRPVGSKNRRNPSLKAMLVKLDVDPIEGLAIIARDPTVATELRLKAYASLAPYVYPRLTAVTVKDDAAPRMGFVLNLSGSHSPELENPSPGASIIIPGEARSDIPLTVAVNDESELPELGPGERWELVGEDE